jgi:predicted Zn-dependent peptidase
VKSIHYKKIGETIYYEELSNGLEVFILPKKGFYKTVTTFTTNYGSVDNFFSPLGKGIPIEFPAGIAHFLEHQMFESEKGDVFSTFARQGAFVNAYTNFTRTAYTVSATSNIKENITTLLDFVQDAYFTDETVKKEKGIIEQEIKMYEDNLEWRARFEILKNMYKYHPVRNDIAGTVKSINQITKEDLYTCYHTFYHPKNMLLFVIGPVDPKDLIDSIGKNQEQKTFQGNGEKKCIFPDEDKKVYKKSGVMEFPVQIPKVFIGYKKPNSITQGQELLKYELALKVLLELMFGDSSEANEKMYNSGHIDESFTFECTIEGNFGYSIISGESKEPQEVINTVYETVSRFKRDPIKRDNAQRVVNKEIGCFLRSINSPQFIANQFTRYHFNGTNLFDVIHILEKLTEKDLEEVLHLHFSDESSSTLIIK